MRDALTVRVGGAVFHGSSHSSGPYGIIIGKDGFTGWEGIPTRRREQVARAVEHGEHDVPLYLGSRVVTIDGWIHARSAGELASLSQQVTGLGADGGRVTVTVDHQGQTLHAYARVLIATATDRGLRQSRQFLSAFQIQFVFADPRKYGPLESFPATGYATINDAYQRGNFPAHPVIEFGSGPTSWTLSAPGRSLQVSGVTAGGVQRFDMRTGRLTRAGVDVTDSVTITGDVWAVPVGATWRHTLNVPGRVLLPETYV